MWMKGSFSVSRPVSGSGSVMRGSCGFKQVEAVISCRRYRGHWPTHSWTRCSSSWLLGETLFCYDESLFLNLTWASSHFISIIIVPTFRHICSPLSWNSFYAIIGHIFGDGLKMAAKAYFLSQHNRGQQQSNGSKNHFHFLHREIDVKS